MSAVNKKVVLNLPLSLLRVGVGRRAGEQRGRGAEVGVVWFVLCFEFGCIHWLFKDRWQSLASQGIACELKFGNTVEIIIGRF